jgi:hypothetical protein
MTVRETRTWWMNQRTCVVRTVTATRPGTQTRTWRGTIMATGGPGEEPVSRIGNRRG